MTLDVNLSDGTPVRGHTQAARFFREGNKTLVEISFVGSKDTNICKVTPEHMARFKTEWDAFCDGRPLERRPGIPLTTLPTISEQRAAEYIARNVHNLEELAVLNDGQCQSLGHGVLTHRQEARALVAKQTYEQQNRAAQAIKDKQASVGKVVAAAEPSPEIEALKADMAEIKELLAGLAAPKRGRPRKEVDDGAIDAA